MTCSDILNADLLNCQTVDDGSQKHSCRTYFYVSGNITAEDFKKRMSLLSTPVDKISGALRVGDNRRYNLDVNVMLTETLRELFGKERELKELREELSLDYSLVISPILKSESESPLPILSLDDKIIKFLYLTGTHHELDPYVY